MALRGRGVAREFDGADWVAYRASSENAEKDDNASMSSSSSGKQYWKEFDPMSMPKASSSLTSPLLGMRSNYGYTALGGGAKPKKKKTSTVDESELVLCCRKSCFQFLSTLFAVAAITFFILWSAEVSIYTPTTMGLNGPVSFSSSKVDVKWDSTGGKALVKLPVDLPSGKAVLNASNYAFGMFNFAADALDGGVVYVGTYKDNICTTCTKRSVGKIKSQTDPISPAVWEISATATDGTCFRHGDTKPTKVTFYTGKWNSLLYLIPSSFDKTAQFPKLLMGLFTDATTSKVEVACAALNTTTPASTAVSGSLRSAITCTSPYCGLTDVGATVQYGESWESTDTFKLPSCCSK